MTWATLTTPQRIHLISAVWRDDMTSEQIAKAVGATKGSVIGIYRRYADQLASTPLRPRGAHMINRKPVEVKPVFLEPLKVLLEDCNGCTWPLNDGGPYLFCGHAKFGKYSYCEHHHERSRGRGTDSERSAHRVSERHASS